MVFYLFYVVIFCVRKFFDFAWVIKEEASEAKIWLAVNRAILNLSTESVKVLFCSHTSSLLAGWEQLESDYLIAQKDMNSLGLKINYHKPVWFWFFWFFLSRGLFSWLLWFSYYFWALCKRAVFHSIHKKTNLFIKLSYAYSVTPVLNSFSWNAWETSLTLPDHVMVIIIQKSTITPKQNMLLCFLVKGFHLVL